MFKLEIVKNTLLGNKDDGDISVSEAIFSTYLEYETDIHLYWDDLILCLSRRGDIADIYNDIVQMLEALEVGYDNFFIPFLSSSFTAHWSFRIIAPDTILIDAKWFDVVYLDENKNFIKKSHMEISASDFIKQWNKILLVIKRNLISIGYSNSLIGFEYLDRL